jgi:hypothetical protein
MMREGRFFYGLSDEIFAFYQKKIRLTTDETRSHHFSGVSMPFIEDIDSKVSMIARVRYIGTLRMKLLTD